LYHLCRIKSLFDSLTPKSLAGTKTSLKLKEGFGASETQSNKHPHHDGPVCPSSGMVLLAEHTPPPGAPAEGVGQGRRRRVLAESIKSGEIIYFYYRSPAVGNDSQNGIHCCWRAAVIYKLNYYIATNNIIALLYFQSSIKWSFFATVMHAIKSTTEKMHLLHGPFRRSYPHPCSRCHFIWLVIIIACV
jgi:hypothetical protein